MEKELYAVKNIDEDEYLNYASKKKKLFGKGTRHYVVQSPFPTLRPKEHIKKHFVKWIINTPNPEDYRIVKFTEHSQSYSQTKEEQDGN